VCVCALTSRYNHVLKQTVWMLVCRIGQNSIYTHTVYDRVFGAFPAQNTVYTPYEKNIYRLFTITLEIN